MEVLSMFQRPRSVALEYEKPGTYGTVLIYPLDRLVECGSAVDSVRLRIDSLCPNLRKSRHTIRSLGESIHNWTESNVGARNQLELIQPIVESTPVPQERNEENF
ncbi:hypothetical protein PIB30_061186 [Stylosanthes scabra]|uniref:Uncharacterized protein n=1 Tax=Stylosanthes scabra TaxID=79078 RepID=A0ABU6SLZ0_9FABA|nr:hypothetical protein [Stylosanthes scabra]